MHQPITLLFTYAHNQHTALCWSCCQVNALCTRSVGVKRSVRVDTVQCYEQLA